jgi:transketolase
MKSASDLTAIATRLRGDVVEMSHRCHVSHLASALSCVDIVVAAYWGVLDVTAENVNSRTRDRFVLSKGHAAPILYAALARLGIISNEILTTIGQEGSPLAEQPAPHCVPGVEWATGSLGHGLGVTIGILLAARLQKNPVKAVVLLSDGECNEGSVWEAAMFAPSRGLDNLVVVIDFNKWQATGRSREIMALDPLAAKWAAFGWHSEEVDGHDIQALQSAMRAAFARRDGRPSAIIAHTVKGKGISFMEDDNNWHYLTPNEEQLARALHELGLAQ